MRNVQIIGNLWPLCENCLHIAQEHDRDGCGAMVRCSHCNHLNSLVRCSCKDYKGPTLQEFMDKFMTPEEKAHYGKLWKL